MRNKNRFNRIIPQLEAYGAPTIIFVGSSHVAHLKDVTEKTKMLAHTPKKFVDFLADARYVGCGGLKYWSAPQELNGIFHDDWKAEKYGNLWAAYDELNFTPEWWVGILGSNDTDDFCSYGQKLYDDHGYSYFDLI